MTWAVAGQEITNKTRIRAIAESQTTSAGGTVFDLSAVIVGGDGIIAELSRCQKLFGHLPSSSAAGTDGLTTCLVLYGDIRI